MHIYVSTILVLCTLSSMSDLTSIFEELSLVSL